jgi:anti-anti-sigma regulatory factor
MRLPGDLDYESIGELVDTASQLLAQQGDLADLHLDLSELTFLDSAALSGLLLIHRRTRIPASSSISTTARVSSTAFCR